VARIRAQLDTAPGTRLRPVGREEFSLVAGKARIGLLQAIGHRARVGVRAESFVLAQRIEPAREFARRELGPLEEPLRGVGAERREEVR